MVIIIMYVLMCNNINNILIIMKILMILMCNDIIINGNVLMNY